jgi:hypothetical protein
VNRDGLVDQEDANLVLSQLAGLSPAQADTTLADVDADRRITSRDALLILHHAEGDGPSSRAGEPAE